MYMFNKLKLYMTRYQIIWILEKIFTKMEELAEAISQSKDEQQINELKCAMSDLSCEMLEYKKYLSKNQ